MRKNPWSPGGAWCPEGASALLVRAMRETQARARRAALWYTAKLVALAVAPAVLAALIILNFME